MKNGFTLIELLVVVLIIGVLAAIAFPQYERAIERARAAEAITNLKLIEEAQRRHFLINGDYSADMRRFDVNIQTNTNGSTVSTKYFTYQPVASTGTNYLAYALRLPYNTNDRTYYLAIYPTGQRLRCNYYNTKGQEMCKSLSKLVDNY